MPITRQHQQLPQSPVSEASSSTASTPTGGRVSNDLVSCYDDIHVE
jgi:hypothetical protein